jgi:hypothetical protein
VRGIVSVAVTRRPASKLTPCASKPLRATRNDGADQRDAAFPPQSHLLLASARWTACPGCLCPASRAPGPDGTTQQHNTHITDVREICYSWHPWHGRAVRVHASLVKRGQAVAYCSLEDVQACRVLEVPL